MSKIFKKSIKRREQDDKSDCGSQADDENEDDDLDREKASHAEREVKRGLRIEYPAIEVSYQDQDVNDPPFRQ